MDLLTHPRLGRLTDRPELNYLGRAGQSAWPLWMRVTARTSYARHFYFIHQLYCLVPALFHGVLGYWVFLHELKSLRSDQTPNVLMANALRLWNGARRGCRQMHEGSHSGHKTKE